MPFQPSAPNTGTVTTEAEQLMGTMKIHELNLKIDPNDQQNVQAEVRWSEGYVKDVEGVQTYMALKFHKAVITGQNLIDKITEVPSGQSVYDAVKTRAWELLQMEPADSETKYIGSGVIS
jgi:hypothetical protein